MALDIAEFQWNKFVKSLEEAESEFSGAISISYLKDLISYFKRIKNAVEEMDIMPESYAYTETIRVLYELNDALTDCRIFTYECKQLNKKLLLFNPLTYYFINKKKNRLKEIKRELQNLAGQTEENNTRDCPPDKSQPILSSEVFGFDEHVDKIERLLLGGVPSSRTRLTAIGVVGIAGVGKTTLVQKVLERKGVKDEFHPIIWLPFSGMTEEQKQFSRLSFETCVLDNLGHTLDGRIVGLAKILERLNQLLSGKKYLIVLDDVQRRHINIEDRLWRGLPKGSGGAVIVTSRLKEVAQKLVEQNNLIHVKPLDKEVCWSIFHDTIKNDTELSSISHLETLGKIKKEIMDQCHGLPLAAKTFAQIIPEQIREIESKRFLKEMYIPDELLKPDLNVEPALHIPNFPVLVFIDMKDEEHGERLYKEFCYRLNRNQVFAVLQDNSDSKKKVKASNPESVIKEVYGSLQTNNRFPFASDIQKKMRIIIVGGDAVANWILGVICDLKLPEPPSFVPIPQGTENNIPLSFGWKELHGDRQSVTLFLDQVTGAQQMETDSWHILVKMKATESSTAHGDIPHSLHLFRTAQEGVTQNADNLILFGGFWSYFSLGVDAPGWYGSRFHRTTRTVKSFVKVKVVKNDQREQSLKIPSGIKSIICLNLPSQYPWGSSNKKKDRQRQLTPPLIDDGHLEIIGLKDVFLPQNERIFLGKVRGIRFEFIEAAEEFVNMRIDGAPWKKIPLDGIMDIKISCHSKVNILANGDCPAKRSHVASQPSTSGADDNENAEDNSKQHYASQPSTSGAGDNANAKDNSEKRMKFGHTVTFKR